MKQIKFEYSCDLCGKYLGDDKKYEGIRIANNEESVHWDSDKSYTTWIEQWDLCNKCFDKFNGNREKALEYLKENKWENDDGF